jgi:hypothetical protein
MRLAASFHLATDRPRETMRDLLLGRQAFHSSVHGRFASSIAFAVSVRVGHSKLGEALGQRSVQLYASVASSN